MSADQIIKSLLFAIRDFQHAEDLGRLISRREHDAVTASVHVRQA